jgi:hypothetical protein
MVRRWWPVESLLTIGALTGTQPRPRLGMLAGIYFMLASAL